MTAPRHPRWPSRDNAAKEIPCPSPSGARRFCSDTLSQGRPRMPTCESPCDFDLSGRLSGWVAGVLKASLAHRDSRSCHSLLSSSSRPDVCGAPAGSMFTERSRNTWVNLGFEAAAAPPHFAHPPPHHCPAPASLHGVLQATFAGYVTAGTVPVHDLAPGRHPHKIGGEATMSQHACRSLAAGPTRRESHVSPPVTAPSDCPASPAQAHVQAPRGRLGFPPRSIRRAATQACTGETAGRGLAPRTGRCRRRALCLTAKSETLPAVAPVSFSASAARSRPRPPTDLESVLVGA